MDEPQFLLDSRRPAVLQLAHLAAMMAAESQPLFEARFGGRKATVDLSGDHPLFLLSTPEANLEFGAQLVGTHDTQANTWTWGWRDGQGWNPWTVGASRALLSIGEALEDADILLGSMPYQEGMDLLCTAATQAAADLYVRYELVEGSLRHHILLINSTLFDLPEPTPTATMQALHRAAAAPWFTDARTAVRSYGVRRWGVRWEEDELGIATLSMDRGSVRIGFDESDGVRSVEVHDAGSWLPAPADDGVAATFATRGPVGSGFATPAAQDPQAEERRAPTYSTPRPPAPQEPGAAPAPAPVPPSSQSPAPAPAPAPVPAPTPAQSQPSAADTADLALAERQRAVQAEFDAAHAGRTWRLSLEGPQPHVEFLNGAGQSTRRYAAHLLGAVRARPELWQWAWSLDDVPAAATQRSATLRALGEATSDPVLGLPESAYEPGLEDYFVQLYVKQHGAAPLLRGRLGNASRVWVFLEEL